MTFKVRFSCATSLTPETEIVDHSRAVGGWRFLLQLVDLLHDDIEAAMAFDRVPIGIGDGLPQESRLPEGLPLGAGCPELEPPSGAVEMFLLPGHRDHLDAAAPLPELVPNLPVSPAPVIELASGSHSRVDVDEDGPVRLNSHWQPEGEILDPPPGAAGIDPAGQQVRSDPELLEAGDLLLLGPQPGHLRMIEHDIKRKQAPPCYFRRGLPGVTQVGDLQEPVDLSGEKVADAPAAPC